MLRHARQTKLREVGDIGQARIASARVDVRLSSIAGEVAVRYLAGAGFGALRVREDRLAQVARAIDAEVFVQVDASIANEAAGGYDLRDPAAREVAAGARAALQALRTALGVVS